MSPAEIEIAHEADQGRQCAALLVAEDFADLAGGHVRIVAVK